MRIARQIPVGDVIIEAPESLEIRKQLHALQGTDPHILAVDVQRDRPLIIGKIAVPVLIIIRALDHFPEIRIRETVFIYEDPAGCPDTDASETREDDQYAQKNREAVLNNLHLS